MTSTSGSSQSPLMDSTRQAVRPTVGPSWFPQPKSSGHHLSRCGPVRSHDDLLDLRIFRTRDGNRKGRVAVIVDLVVELGVGRPSCGVQCVSIMLCQA